MSTWEAIEGHLTEVNTKTYDFDKRRDIDADGKARNAIRKLVLSLERDAAERDTLRAMLLEQGTENAHLLVEIEQLKVQLAAATSSFVAEERHCEICAQETFAGKEQVARADAMNREGTDA